MKWFTLTPAILLILATGCGADRETATGESPASDPSAVSTAAGAPPPLSTAGSPVPASEQANRVDVRMVDYRFEMPNRIAAGPTRFVVRNDGQHKHNFEIEGEGIEEELEKDLESGQSGELTVELKPGRYRVYCPVGDHATKHGMETTLEVN